MTGLIMDETGSTILTLVPAYLFLFFLLEVSCFFCVNSVVRGHEAEAGGDAQFCKTCKEKRKGCTKIQMTTWQDGSLNLPNHFLKKGKGDLVPPQVHRAHHFCVVRSEFFFLLLCS